MTASPHTVINQQLGANCNPDDKITIEGFKGYLAWTYAQRTNTRQDFKGPLVPMTDDFGGADLMLTVKCERLSRVHVLTLRPQQELHLPDCAGETLELTYSPIDHVAIVLIESSVGGVLNRAG